MILSGKEILLNIGNEIKIDPFDKKKINPNSYNLSLHDELVVYDMRPLDMKKNNKTKNIKIPDRGLVLKPGRLYLGRTIEHTETHNLVPMIEGRSSVGRLGIFVHITAGFGDVGFIKGFGRLKYLVLNLCASTLMLRFVRYFIIRFWGNIMNIKAINIRAMTVFRQARCFRN